MAKAIFTRRFDATDTKKGVSVRVEPSDDPQTFPEWVIAKAEKAGSAIRHTKDPATAGASKEK